MQVFPQLVTDRLVIRKIQVDDVPALVKYANNRKIADRIVNISYPYQEHHAVFRLSYVLKGFKNKTHYAFAIIAKEREELIGEISLHLMDKHQSHGQLAYWIAEPFWNQGMGTEAIEAVLKFGFNQLELGLIYADCHLTNQASQKVLLKNRMLQHTTKGNLLLFKITKEEYEKQKMPQD